MRKFWSDRIALGFAVAGIVLMALALAWRINPVEGSVIPGFLTGNPVGQAVVVILLVTCMPVWILSVFLAMVLPVPERTQYVFACVAMIVLQGLVYFLIGKGIAVCIRKLLRKKEPSKQGGQAAR